MEHATHHPDSQRDSALRLAGYSFLILFFELALIRYVPAHVRVFGFYLNFVLIATFLGMGVGLLRVNSKTRLEWLAIPATIVLFGAVKIFSNVIVTVPRDPNDYLWGIFAVAPSVTTIGTLSAVTILFTLCAIFFIPLGLLMGREFRRFTPLQAYSLDIAGSLLGIFAFAAMSVLRTPPAVWFAVGSIIWVALAARRRWFAGGVAVAGTAATAMAFWTAGPLPEYWSPYYRINPEPYQNLLRINVNGTLHQVMVDLDTTRATPFSARARYDYLRPHHLLNRIDTALVVGAGNGNDVALLLEQGAAYVDAVEIDPVIQAIGGAAHAQAPYADPRVHVHIDDARAFLRNTDQQYDLIVFGTLDSHTLLSGMSSLRLDNYVYTRESFEMARQRLTPEGTLVTYHMSGYPYIAAKIAGMLEAAFEEPPAIHFNQDHRLFNYTFMAGHAAARGKEAWGPPPAALLEPVDLPTDNWPYLYLRQRMVPGHYTKALAMVLIVGAVLITGASFIGRSDRPRGFDFPMFFMGVGFLLVETKSVTEISLLFGSTWTVNLLVFSSILTVILLANVWVFRQGPRSPTPWFALLFVSLLIAYLVPVRLLLPLGVAGQWLVGGLVVALPVLFAAIIFATMFATRANATQALAANLLGAIGGGVLEYSGMLIGIKGLYAVAAVAYLAAWLTSRRRVAASDRLPSSDPLSTASEPIPAAST
jgi:spermidine synthase